MSTMAIVHSSSVVTGQASSLNCRIWGLRPSLGTVSLVDSELLAKTMTASLLIRGCSKVLPLRMSRAIEH
jgi:hypothetical protein